MTGVNDNNYQGNNKNSNHKPRKRGVRGGRRKGHGNSNNQQQQQQQHRPQQHQQHYNKRPRSSSKTNDFYNETSDRDFNRSNNNPFINNPTNNINNWQTSKLNENQQNNFEVFEQQQQQQQQQQEQHLQNADTSLNTTITDNSTDKIRLAILPKYYPTTLLTNDELSKLEDAIIDEVKLGWDSKLMFDDIHFRSSLLLIDCASQETANWLLRSASKLKTWSGPKLRACKENELTPWYYIKVNFPKSADQNPEEILALIDAQNVGLNVKCWKLISSKKNENVQLLTFAIDESSKNTIITSGYTMRYRFGKVFVFDIVNATENVYEMPIDVSSIHTDEDKTTSFKKIPIETTPKIAIKKILDKKI